MNTFGQHFRLTTFGESHGTALGAVIDGCPSGIVFDRELLDREMQRRHIGQWATPRSEPDKVEILSGIFEGETLGTPIGIIIHNSQQHSEDYNTLRDCFRPGHADYTWQQRFAKRDYRGGGRASARETAARVAAGAIAKMYLRLKSIEINAYIKENPTPVTDDSVGGIISCTINGVPAGIGNPIFGKLNSQLASAMMSIPSAIGFEMGAGFAAANMKGSQFRDAWNADFTTATNHCGGIQGGISNGMPIQFNVAFHPVVTLPIETECLTNEGKIQTIDPGGRHDRNHVPRTVVVVEAMAALVIADMILSKE